MDKISFSNHGEDPEIPTSPQCEELFADGQISEFPQNDEKADPLPATSKSLQHEGVVPEHPKPAENEEIIVGAPGIQLSPQQGGVVADSPEAVIDAVPHFAPHFVYSNGTEIDQDTATTDQSLPPMKRMRLSEDEKASASGGAKDQIQSADLFEQNGVNDDNATYCICNEIFYGKMIFCDEETCRIKWFHFPCVNVKREPKGNWYCPQCRAYRRKANLVAPPRNSSGGASTVNQGASTSKQAASKSKRKASTSKKEASNSKQADSSSLLGQADSTEQDGMKRGFSCPICFFITFTPEERDAHKSSHSVGNLHKCKSCAFATSFACTFRNHLLRFHPHEKHFECSICKYRCADLESLGSHFAAHELDMAQEDEGFKMRKLKCAFCEYRGSTLKGLQMHMKIHSEDSDSTVKENPMRRKEDESLAPVKAKQELESHIKSLHSESVTKGSLCESKSTLKQDKRSLCRNYKTKSVSQEEVALQRTKNVACSLCKYKCASKQELLFHFKSIHEKCDTQCTLCEFKCLSKQELASHIISVHTALNEVRSD